MAPPVRLTAVPVRSVPCPAAEVAPPVRLTVVPVRSGVAVSSGRALMPAVSLAAWFLGTASSPLVGTAVVLRLLRLLDAPADWRVLPAALVPWVAVPRFTWLPLLRLDWAAEDPLRLTWEPLLRLAWLELVVLPRFTWEDEAGREAEEELVEREAELEVELEFLEEPPVRD